MTGDGGEVDPTTVSGTATIELTDVTRARLKSVSGDMTAALALASDGQIEGESVSGDIALNIAARRPRISMRNPSAAASRTALGPNRSTRSEARDRGCASLTAQLMAACGSIPRAAMYGNAPKA